MAVSVEVKTKSLEFVEDSSHIHYVPCLIEHDGEATVNNYFKSFVKEETVKTDEGEKNVLVGSLRGYPLIGERMKVPEGYTGVLLRETQPGQSIDEDRTKEAVCKFNSFTFWNWDRNPSRSDRYQQTMDWTAVASVIHGEDN